MIDARTLWQLDPPLARVLRDFILHPSVDMHPDRLAALWPGPESADQIHRPRGDAALSRLLFKLLELDEQVPLDLDDPLHRCALLPPPGLQQVVRSLEVRLLAPRLRRVILREELQRLQAVMDPRDWALALDAAEAPHAAWQSAGLQDLPIDDLCALFDCLGWSVLEAALSGLAPAVSKRALLKMPIPQRPEWMQGITVSQAGSWVGSVYPTAVLRWSDTWDDGWLSRRAA